jgi:hypothetical protein
VTLAGSGSDPDGDALSYKWDFDGDGTYEVAGRSPTFSAADLDGPGSRALALQVCDDQDSCATATATVTVNNVAPTVTGVAGPERVITGAEVAFTGTATDPSTADTKAGFTWQWAVDAGTLSKEDPTFSTCGDRTLKATATDKDGGISAAFGKAVKVYDVRFLAPLDEGVANTVQEGRVVPVKIAVGCGGTALTGLAPEIELLKGNQTPGGESGTDEVETLVPTADSSGVMRAVEGGYLYNLRVPDDAAATPGAQYTIRIRPFDTSGDAGAGASKSIVLEIKR